MLKSSPFLYFQIFIFIALIFYANLIFVSKFGLKNKKSINLKRHLPSALIIGVKKCGTRALLEFLRLHPNVKAAGSEIHFFDRFYNNGYEWYRSKMPLSNITQITVEKTPRYWVTKNAPQRIAKMNRTIKLLVIVRDPVTRMISDYTQVLSKRLDMRKFESLVFINDSSPVRIVNTSWGPVKLGMYVKFLKNWLNHFPLEQFLFVSGERLISDPAVEMYRVQKFLKLPTLIDNDSFYFDNVKGFPCFRKFQWDDSYVRCLGRTKGRNHPKINKTIINRLRSFYKPFNEFFFQLIDFDFGWP